MELSEGGIMGIEEVRIIQGLIVGGFAGFMLGVITMCILAMSRDD